MYEQLVHVLDALCTSNGSPLSREVLRFAKEGQWSELQQLSVEKSAYKNSESLWKDAMCVDFLRKAQLDTGVDKEKRAIETFHECEMSCARTNLRLNRFIGNYGLSVEDEPVCIFIDAWRKEIKRVLGRMPDDLPLAFGKGATLSNKGQLITIPDKMSSAVSMYQSTSDLIPLWERSAWARSLLTDRQWYSAPTVVRGNCFTTVPKDGLKDRGIAIEASLSLAFQLGVGRVLKDKLLLNCGLDLRNGQAYHRSLAKIASETGWLATLDLSNASDTVSYSLVKLLLPQEWFLLLTSLRAEYTQVGDDWFRLEKFSSMGNGFTFELETMIFATLARTIALLRGDSDAVTVSYGDDLIVSTCLADDLSAALTYFGFVVNQNKSFVKGLFRESCGGDFFLGVPVRAFFVKELPDDPQKWISVVNGLRRACFLDVPHRLAVFRWAYVSKAWKRALKFIPSSIRRLRGPEKLGDIVIHDDRAWVMKRPKFLQDGIDQVYVKTWSPVPVVLDWHHWYPSVQLAAALLGLPSRGITPRGGVSGFREKWVPIRGLALD